MTKLKTLKDLDLNYEDIWDWNKGTPQDILKKEAIKWVKEANKEKRLVMQWDFMKFFNITEEDLNA